METRDTALILIRPEIPSAKITSMMSDEEYFQNTTLRPVAKLQNDLLVEVFKNYVRKHKNVFYGLSIEKRLDYVENAIHKDMKFRNSLKGIININQSITLTLNKNSYFCTSFKKNKNNDK